MPTSWSYHWPHFRPSITTASEPLRPNRNSRLLESARLGSPSNAIATSAAGAVSAAEMALASVIESHLQDGRAQPQARPAHAHGCLGKEPYEEC